MRLFSGLVASLAASAGLASAFNANCNSNYVSYYGQNSAGNQKTLGEYCKDSTEDLIVLAFMNGFPNIIMNFANACETTFPGSSLLHCPNIAQDIKYCQSQGKAVILSMGGASGAYGFSSDSQGAQFADTVWNMFFKGSSDQRPFDDAVLDGIDLDIEGGGGSGYVGFINQLRSHYASDPGRQYYIAAAPQCPYPDSYLGSTLNSAWFDMVFVQFYNNYCGLNAYPTWFNYADWDNWAKTSSVNKNVKIYIGAPGSPSAASSGYVSGSTLSTIYSAVRSQYSSLGGIMTWDVSQARTSGLAGAIRSALDSGKTCSSNPGGGGGTTTTTTTTSKTSTTSTTPTSTVVEYTTTSTTSQPTTTSSPSTCPVNGGKCSGNQQGCSGQKFAICNGGSWWVSSCAPGTYCYLNGNMATCDWANGRPTDGCSVSGSMSFSKRQDLIAVNKITKPSLRPKPANAKSKTSTRVEFVVSELANNQFSTVIKIQTNKDAFSGNWSISFTLPSGQKIESTSRGSASTNGNTVTIKSDISREESKNMAAIFKISGTYTGEYVLPDTNTASFVTS
ncbi:Chitinase 2 [Coemansia sp. IMI 203386]|nr:Chitinase 2 [Coemansia sp. IMI 203386]